MADLCSGGMACERALPPMRPPRRPRLTAAGSLPCSSGVGSRSSTSPVAMSTMAFASWLASRGRFLGILLQVASLQALTGKHARHCLGRTDGCVWKRARSILCHRLRPILSRDGKEPELKSGGLGGLQEDVPALWRIFCLCAHALNRDGAALESQASKISN